MFFLQNICNKSIEKTDILHTNEILTVKYMSEWIFCVSKAMTGMAKFQQKKYNINNHTQKLVYESV